MKRFIASIILSIAVYTVAAQPVDSLKAANDYYAANQITQAINAYEYVLANGYESAALYYNLGNAYYKNNELVNALLNYERAKKLAPFDEDLQFNLDLANQFVVDKIEALPRPFFIKWGQNIASLMTIDQWAILSMICFIMTLVFALGYVMLLTPALKKWAFGLGIVLLFLSASSFSIAAKQRYKEKHQLHAIIFSPSVTVKASPNSNSVDLFVIHEGLKVEILKNHNAWLEIKLEDGNQGWVQKESLKII
ncbi:MAG: tetratricopeptide repeat protein [Prolixibacteraceae bacterium]|nr:tetratricopeptide repeat protein [Prolixibacteraceae bacterium]